MSRVQSIAVIAVLGILNIILLYRRITFIGKLTVSLWVGTILTALAVIVTGAFNFDPAIAFDFPPGAFNFSLGFFLGLGAATRIGIFDYLGYYDICYIGEEVEEPGRHDSALDHHQRDRSRVDLHRHKLLNNRCRSMAGIRPRRPASTIDFHCFDLYGKNLRRSA